VRAQGGFVQILPGKLAPVEPAFAIYADECGRRLKAEKGLGPPQEVIRAWFRELVEGRLFARGVTSEVFAFLRDPASWEQLWTSP